MIDIVTPFNESPTGASPTPFLLPLSSRVALLRRRSIPQITLIDRPDSYVEMVTGFHARTVDEFASALHAALCLHERPEEELAMRRRARANSLRFDEAKFEESFKELWDLGCLAPDKRAR